MILNVSEVPGSPQSVTSTVKDWLVVPVELVTAAIPVNVAWVFGPQVPLLMASELYDISFIRTPAA